LPPPVLSAKASSTWVAASLSAGETIPVAPLRRVGLLDQGVLAVLDCNADRCFLGHMRKRVVARRIVRKLCRAST